MGAVPVALVDPFVSPILDCLNPDMPWPSLEDPGLPNFLLGLLSTNLAGINFILELDPTQPKLPTIDLFIEAFGVTIPSANIPEIDILGIKIPAIGDGPPAFDLSGLIGLMELFILLPFNIILGILKKFPLIQLPTLDGIKDLIFEIGVDAGLPLPTLELLAPCVSKGILGLLGALLPV
jgi:hypothetical protein